MDTQELPAAGPCDDHLLGRQEGDTRWSVSGTCLATSEKGQRGAWSGRENGVCMKVGGARGRVDGSDCGSGRGQGV